MHIDKMSFLTSGVTKTQCESSKVKYIITLLVYTLFSSLLFLSLYSCGGGSGSGSDHTPTGNNPGVPVSLVFTPERTVGQTNSPLFMTALVTDGNGSPVQGETISFINTSGLGTLNTVTSKSTNSKIDRASTVINAVTNNYGQADVQVSTTTPGYVTVEAISGSGLSDRKSIYFSSTGMPLSFTPLSVGIDIDGDGDGIYNEVSDLIICSTGTTSTLTIKATSMFMNAPLSGIAVDVQTDNTSLDAFNTLSGCDIPLTCTDFTQSPPVVSTDPPICTSTCSCVCLSGTPVGDGDTDIAYLTTDSTGEAFTELKITCPATNLQQNISVLASTGTYFLPQFNNNFFGFGGSTLFLQPLSFTGVNVSSSNSSVILDGTSTITASVNTTQGIATAPNSTIVQFSSSCGFVSPSSSQTSNGTATTTFRAPSTLPSGGTCTVTADAGGFSGSTFITIVDSMSMSPSSITLTNPSVGDSRTYTISGGVSPYTATTDTPQLADVTIAGSTLTVTLNALPAADTPVTITVTDANNNTATATLDLVTTFVMDIAPSAVTVSGQTNPTSTYGSADFAIHGGFAPYIISWDSVDTLVDGSSSPVTTSSTQFTVVTGHQCVVGTDVSVTLTVTDAFNNSDTATYDIDCDITNVFSPVTMTPATVTITNPGVGDSRTYTVAGGTTPYTATTDHPELATVSVSGTDITITLIALPASDTPITITVTDAANNMATAILDLLTTFTMDIVPSTVSVTGQTSPSSAYGLTTFTIHGGFAPFIVSWDSISGLVNGSSSPVTTSTSQFTMGTNLSCIGSDLEVTVTVTDSFNNIDTSTYNIICAQ